MTGLTAAHRGYEYQDLMTACPLVDVVLGTAHGVLVDEKLSLFEGADGWRYQGLRHQHPGPVPDQLAVPPASSGSRPV